MVLTDNWEWVEGDAYEPGSSPNLMDGSHSDIDGSATTIDITFDPITTGEDFFVIKRLKYTGPNILPGAQFSTTIDIIANPLVIPEPAGMALMLMSAALFIRRR